MPLSAFWRSLGQPSKRSLQSPCKFSVRGLYLSQQPLNHSLERSGEFGSIQLPHQGRFKRRSHSGWQEVHTSALRGGKAMAKASEGERVVTDAANHIFRLPQFAARNTTPRMKRIKPRHANDCCGLWWRGVAGFIRLSKYQSERRGQGAKFRLDDESQIHLKGIGKKKYSVGPRASYHVEMMYGMMAIVHVSRPIGEDTLEITSSGNTKGEVYVRPFVFSGGGSRAREGGACDPAVIAGVSEETGALPTGETRRSCSGIVANFERSSHGPLGPPAPGSRMYCGGPDAGCLGVSCANSQD